MSPESARGDRFLSAGIESTRTKRSWIGAGVRKTAVMEAFLEPAACRGLFRDGSRPAIRAARIRGGLEADAVHLVTATCGDVEQFLNVNVLAETVNNVDDGTLARTGSSNTGPLIGIGAAAVVLGGAFLYGARRPRQA